MSHLDVSAFLLNANQRHDKVDVCNATSMFSDQIMRAILRWFTGVQKNPSCARVIVRF